MRRARLKGDSEWSVSFYHCISRVVARPLPANAPPATRGALCFALRWAETFSRRAAATRSLFWW